ncbi:MAG: hypothetical protein ACM3JP_00295 [Betaproteobacteria bacterium]
MRSAPPMRSCRPIDPRGRRAGARLAGVLAGLVLLLGLVPAAPVGAVPAAGIADPRPMPGLGPSIQYEQAMAHAADTTVFAPGTRVSVPFTPRTADRWTIDGLRPVSLPAGRLTGKAIRDARSVIEVAPATGSPKPVSGAKSPIDTPFVNPAAAVSAQLAAVVDPSLFVRWRSPLAAAPTPK